ncbi:MAG: VOC family protein [Mycobacteriales bacterium]
MPAVSLVIHTTDLERSATFYETVVGLDRTLTDEGMIFMSANGVEVLLHHDPNPEPARRGVSPTFDTDNVDAAIARAQKLGCEIYYGPANEPWGARSASVCDPDGHGVALNQKISPGTKSHRAR